MTKAFTPLKLALGGLGLFLVAAAISRLDGWGLPAANESAIDEISRWCERVSGGLLREPVNTLGNLGFVVSGLAMLYVVGRDETQRRPPTNLFSGPDSLIQAHAIWDLLGAVSTWSFFKFLRTGTVKTRLPVETAG